MVKYELKCSYCPYVKLDADSKRLFDTIQRRYRSLHLNLNTPRTCTQLHNTHVHEINTAIDYCLIICRKLTFLSWITVNKYSSGCNERESWNECQVWNWLSGTDSQLFHKFLLKNSYCLLSVHVFLASAPQVWALPKGQLFPFHLNEMTLIR